jgi:hypothetical protein
MAPFADEAKKKRSLAGIRKAPYHPRTKQMSGLRQPHRPDPWVRVPGCGPLMADNRQPAAPPRRGSACASEASHSVVDGNVPDAGIGRNTKAHRGCD